MSATMTETAKPQGEKREGDISDSFASLCGADIPPLPPRFLELKRSLVAGHTDRVVASWNRLLRRLRTENETLARLGPSVIPSISVDDLDSDISRFRAELDRRGVAVIRGVIPEAEARGFKAEIEAYVAANHPRTKGFPQDDPQVWELYWSPPQVKARAHPNLLKAQRALMRMWHLDPRQPQSAISLSQPLAYADRLRIRKGGDVNFALGPHMDGGSVERWERHGYGRGGVYDAVFDGRWDGHDSDNDNDNEGGKGKADGGGGYDPWDASARVPAVLDNYGGLGACSMFRAWQGWLSMSHTKPGEGTLKTYPLIRESAAYLLLRPFFRPLRSVEEIAAAAGGPQSEFLSEDNWVFAGDQMTSELQGAHLGHGQELSDALHPHLELERAMVHVPEIRPGDFVAWHCDIIHAVDQVHQGTTDSSVLYIPVCPVTEINARYLKRQRDAFLAGTPGPDFPGGAGESGHAGRPTEAYLRERAAEATATTAAGHDEGEDGLRTFGFAELVAAEDDPAGARDVIRKANEILGF